MKHKIFISINIPDKIKKRLVQATDKWRGLPVKWTREANLHVTLVFLGYVDEDSIGEICEAVGRACGKSDAFDITFDKIELFPSKIEPRMIALTGEASDQLKDLVNDIEDALGASSSKKKTFCPHVTLGRIQKFKWEALEEKPAVSEKFALTVAVESVEVMASHFDGEGQGYAVLETCPLR